jgi:hypothetical protein
MNNVNLEMGKGKNPKANFDYIPETQQVGVSTGISTYWTNFEKSGDAFEISRTPVAGYWQFRTNIGWEDLDILWDEKRVKRFLHQMWEIYRYRKVN